MRKVKIILLAVALVALINSNGDLRAQAAADQTVESSAPQPRRKIDPKKLAELREKIEKVKYQKLQENLGLDGASAPKFFAIYRPAEQDIQGLVKQRIEAMEKLNQLTKGAHADGDVDPVMTTIDQLTHKIQDRQAQLDVDLRPILSPRQRARLLVFEQEFNHRVREQVIKNRLRERIKHLDPAQRKRLRQRVQQYRDTHPGPIRKLR
ncbi:MAG: hypothetical protein ABI444_00955 [Candidatus Kapaibacterium sp.]